MLNIKEFPTNTAGKLYFGPWPNIKALRELKELKVDTIWNLAKELKVLVQYEKHFVPNVITGNIEDFDIPENMGKFAAQLNSIASLLEGGKNVFAHCQGGHGRTGMVLAALDLLINDHTPDVALNNAKAACGGPEMKEQTNFIKDLYYYLSGKLMDDNSTKMCNYCGEKLILGQDNAHIKKCPKQTQMEEWKKKLKK